MYHSFEWMTSKWSFDMILLHVWGYFFIINLFSKFSYFPALFLTCLTDKKNFLCYPGDSLHASSWIWHPTAVDWVRSMHVKFPQRKYILSEFTFTQIFRLLSLLITSGDWKLLIFPCFETNLLVLLIVFFYDVQREDVSEKKLTQKQSSLNWG